MAHRMGRMTPAQCAGFNLKRKLGQCGMTQEAFANAFGVDSRTVRRWISSGIHSLDTVAELAQYFGVSVGDILSGPDGNPLCENKKRLRKRIRDIRSESLFLLLYTGCLPSGIFFVIKKAH